MLELYNLISDNPYIFIFLAILCLLVGGGITIGGVRFELPIGIWLKKRMGIKEDSKKNSEDNALERISGLHSYHANTIVLAVKMRGEITSAELRSVSVKANEFFGKTAEPRDQLHGKKAGELLPLLEIWMDEDKFEALAKDQNRVFRQYAKGNVVHANVPVIFNGEHPHYPNRAFLPVIVSYSSERKKGIHGEFEQTLQIVYLDLDPIIPVVEEYASQIDRNTGESSKS